jgi:1-acyl-sn-glycerol-3-phosphate acyltransferase
MIPTIILLPSNKLIEIRKVWIKPILFFLRIFFKVSYEIRGLENLNCHEKFIVASKHHSPLDVLLLSDIFTKPVFILKKSLLKVPVLGWYLSATKMIPVSDSNNSNGTNTLKKMIKKSAELIQKGRTLIIYPEGSRTEVGKTVGYKRGILLLYRNLKLPVIPIALNAGSIWPVGYFSNKNTGKVIIDILKPIPEGLDSNEFLTRLEHEIESNSNKLLIQDETDNPVEEERSNCI